VNSLRNGVARRFCSFDSVQIAIANDYQAFNAGHGARKQDRERVSGRQWYLVK